MRKTMKIVALMAIIIMMAMTGVFAATSATLGNDLYAKLSKYGMVAADKVRVERYVKSHTVTDEQCNEILAKADAVAAIFEEAGVTNGRELSKDQRDQVRALIIEAGKVVGLTVNFYAEDKANIYDADGKLVESYTLTKDGKLAYTGNSTNIVLVVSSLAVIALAATVVAKKANKE